MFRLVVVQHRQHVDVLFGRVAHQVRARGGLLQPIQTLAVLFVAVAVRLLLLLSMRQIGQQLDGKVFQVVDSRRTLKRAMVPEIPVRQRSLRFVCVQELDHLVVAAKASQIRWHFAKVGAWSVRYAMAKQLLNGFDVAIVGRFRCVAFGIATVNVCAALDQLQQNLVVRVQTGQVDRRLAVLIFGVNVPVPTLEQLRHDRVVAFLRRSVQQVRGAVAAHVVRRRIASAYYLQPGHQIALILLVVLDQRIEPMDRCVIVDGKERIVPVASDGVMYYLALEQHRQHITNN
uniref:Uncharacterized protein n=1 Tax=Anopheles coluzzii TaxID=1518534 RepID=A0A8W7P8K6_ANOCL